MNTSGISCCSLEFSPKNNSSTCRQYAEPNPETPHWCHEYFTKLSMEEVTGFQPLQDSRNMKTILQAEKLKCQLKHLMKAKEEGCTRSRLQRDSFGHQVKELEREHLSNLPMQTIQTVLPHSPPLESISLAKMTIYVQWFNNSLLAKEKPILSGVLRQGYTARISLRPGLKQIQMDLQLKQWIMEGRVSTFYFPIAQ